MTGQNIQVTVANGVATLNGKVDNDASRALAAADSASVDGVRTVVNNLVVAPVTRGEAGAGAEAGAAAQAGSGGERASASSSAASGSRSCPGAGADCARGAASASSSGGQDGDFACGDGDSDSHDRYAG